MATTQKPPQPKKRLWLAPKGSDVEPKYVIEITDDGESHTLVIRTVTEKAAAVRAKPRKIIEVKEGAGLAETVYARDASGNVYEKKPRA